MFFFEIRNMTAPKKFLTNFCTQLKKNEITVLSLVFEGFPQTSIPPLKSTILGNDDLRDLRSKVVLNTKHFKNLKMFRANSIVEIQPVVLE